MKSIVEPHTKGKQPFWPETRKISTQRAERSQVTLFAAQPATRLATLGTGDGPRRRSSPVSRRVLPCGSCQRDDRRVNFGRMALANPIAAPVDALLEGLNSSGGVAHQVTITIPAGVPTTANLLTNRDGHRAERGLWSASVGYRPAADALATGRAQSLVAGHPFRRTASFTPIGIPPLTIGRPHQARTPSLSGLRARLRCIRRRSCWQVYRRRRRT